MDSITSTESEAFYNRDFVLGDSTGLISELNESEEEGEDELVLSIPHPVKAEVIPLSKICVSCNLLIDPELG